MVAGLVASEAYPPKSPVWISEKYVIHLTSRCTGKDNIKQSTELD